MLRYIDLLAHFICIVATKTCLKQDYFVDREGLSGSIFLSANKAVMHEPTLCFLDFKTYERQAIIAHLQQNKATPSGEQ